MMQNSDYKLTTGVNVKMDSPESFVTMRTSASLRISVVQMESVFAPTQGQWVTSIVVIAVLAMETTLEMTTPIVISTSTRKFRYIF